MTTFLKGSSSFSLRERKRKKTNVAEEYCWAITKAAVRACCSRSDSGVFYFRFQLNFVLCTCIFGHMRTQFRLAQNSACAGPSGI